jgi:hypothetical protein
VVEVKSYGRVKRAERVQAALYGLLAALNFLAKPEVLVETPEGAEEVEGWEVLALEALSRYDIVVHRSIYDSRKSMTPS